MWCPSKEDHPLLVFISTIDLRKHGLLTRFHNIPAIQLEFLICDDFLDILVCWSAWLNTVNLLAKFVSMG
ncbi:hypothetical protein D3C80_1722280 [compost metagenome]